MHRPFLFFASPHHCYETDPQGYIPLRINKRSTFPNKCNTASGYTAVFKIKFHIKRQKIASKKVACYGVSESPENQTAGTTYYDT
jgi:hypothetical protein